MVHLGWLKEVIEWSNELGQWATMMWSNTPESAKKVLAKSWGGFGTQDNATFEVHVLRKLSVRQAQAISRLLDVLDQKNRRRLTEMAEKSILEIKTERDVNEGKKDKKGNPLPPKKVVETTPDFTGTVAWLKKVANAILAYEKGGGTDLKGWADAQHFGGGLFDEKTFGERISSVSGAIAGFARAHGPVVVQIVGDGAEEALSEFERLVQQAQLAEQVRQSRARRSLFNLPGRIIQRLFNI